MNQMNAKAMTIDEQHEHIMLRCIELATVARSYGNTPVGSIVVIDGVIVSEGIETLPIGSNITGHAELIACQNAMNHTGQHDLRGAILYSTSEPCFMCSYVIREARISELVYGIDTPNIGGVTSGHPILIDTKILGWNPPPKIVKGILWKECQEMRFH